MGAKRIDGVDISHHQNGTIDWALAKRKGLKFVYHKATEGSTYVDGNYGKRRVEAARAGVPFGAYHFARPSKTDALAEAKHFLAVARPRPGDMRPMLDLEVNDGGLSRREMTEWVRVFVSEVKRATGAAPFIYTHYSLDKDFGCPLWVARYSDANTAPAVPLPWKSWAVWQFSNGIFGTPDDMPGFGHVDLNTVSTDPAIFVKTYRLPKAEAPAPKPKPLEAFRYRTAHLSMQFKDSDKEHTADIEKVFSRGYHQITGTEAGPGAGNTRDELLRLGAKYGYRVHVPRRYDTWVAVKEGLVDRDWGTGAEHALNRSGPEDDGRWGPKAAVWAEWTTSGYGQFSAAAIHALTWRAAGDYKTPSDKKYAEVMGEWGRAHAEGTALAFIGGDFNRKDRKFDLFFGQPFTTCWDEMKKWPNTGHGNIDAIASWDGDARVKCISARVVTDEMLYLATDHFLVEATYEIQPLAHHASPAPQVSAFRRKAIEAFRKQGKGEEWMCLKRVRTAYGILAKYSSAIAAWHGTPEKHKHRTNNPNSIPRGYPIFFEGGRFGHIAISLGDGYCLSTDIMRLGYVDRVKIDYIERKWGQRLLGWTDNLNGVDIP